MKHRFVFLMAATGASAVALSMALPLAATTSQDPGWIAVPQRLLDGVDIPDLETGGDDDGLPSSYFTELDPATKPRFGMIHSDLIQSAIVETLSEVTRSVDFPGDEVVRMESGQAILIDEPTGRVQIARAGDFFVVPAHWKGLWIFKSDAGKPAREHATVSAVDYSTSKAPLDAKAFPVGAPRPTVTVFRPGDIEALRAEMTSISFEKPLDGSAVSSLFARVTMLGEPSMIVLEARQPFTQKRRSGCESVVRILNGTMTLIDGSARQSFVPGSVVVIKKAFSGTVEFSRDLSAVSIVSTGQGSPPSPKKAVPALAMCPAL